MSESKKSPGFSESPQAPFEGKPLSGDVSAWAEEIAEEAKEKPKAEKKAGAGKTTKGKSEHSFTSSAGRSLPSDKMQQVGNKRTGGGTSIGGTNDVKQRVAAGLNPVAGLDVSAEDALKMESTSGVTATVQALSDLIEHGRDELKGDIWVPHRPDRPDKDPDQKPFRVVSEFEPKGDQPTAIKELVGGLKGVDWNAKAPKRPSGRSGRPGGGGSQSEPAVNPNRGERTQVLLGVTGSGKTFTMAKVIEETQRPALILAPNKTLAAQLYGEMKIVLPRQCGGIFRLLLRLLPAGSLCAAHRHLHREGDLGQRADRPDAPFGDAGAAGARRRDHRRVRLLHLRHRLGGNLHGDDLPDEGRRHARPAQLLADLVAQQYKRRDMDFQRGIVSRARRHDRDFPGPP